MTKLTSCAERSGAAVVTVPEERAQGASRRAADGGGFGAS